MMRPNGGRRKGGGGRGGGWKGVGGGKLSHTIVYHAGATDYIRKNKKVKPGGLNTPLLM